MSPKTVITPPVIYGVCICKLGSTVGGSAAGASPHFDLPNHATVLKGNGTLSNNQSVGDPGGAP